MNYDHIFYLNWVITHICRLAAAGNKYMFNFSSQKHHVPVIIHWNKSYLLYYLKILCELFFIKKFKFHKRVIKMINFITIINIDTPTWPLPTNTNVSKHTQNSYGMCYLHTTNIFLSTLFQLFYLFILFLFFLFNMNKNIYENGK